VTKSVEINDSASASNDPIVYPLNGLLVRNRIIVWNIECSRLLFGNGYFGKPLGIPKPKGIQFSQPLVLDLIEGYYLTLKSRLKLRNINGRPMSSSNIKSLCKNQYDEFDTKYLVFQELRDRGYIVSPGIKFGCDFAVYERGPGIDHAPYLVQVYKPGFDLTATAIVLAGRLATTVKKQFIVAIPKTKEKKVEFIGFDWWRA
jgi:tRNA-intron endonuclease, archaea type